MHHEIIMLNQTLSGQFYKCACCNRYNLNYKNLFLHFNKKELRIFLKTLNTLEEKHFSQFHPEGYKAVISKRQNPIGIGFTKMEVFEVVTLIEQALVMEQAKAVVNS